MLRLARSSTKKLTFWTTSCRFISQASVSPGFTITHEEELPDFEMKLYTVKHEHTGASIHHFARNDDNCAFSVQFRTVPQDDTGVAHILEHLALCGSKSYPCPDPFFKMMTRSMATFMNAMTAPDFTMYPFSTQNHRDFENLLGIYLDAAFFPNLDYLYFLQEGWRYDAAEGNHSLPMKFTGVVFNEMKGSMNQIQSRYDYVCRKNLMPSNTYSTNFGGEPLSIVDLTHDQLCKFHASHYHPSNSKFITYGNYPLSEFTRLLDELVLSKFDPIAPTLQVPSETRWSSPKKIVEYCAQNESLPQQSKNMIQDILAAPSSKNEITVSCNFLLSDIDDHYSSFCWTILSYLLTSGPSSPFHKTLLQSQLGAAYAPGSGFDSSYRDTSFSIGVMMAKEENIDKIINVIDETIESAIFDGFGKDRLESVLNLIELNLKHQKANFGLNMIMMTSNLINHDCDVVPHLRFSENSKRLQSDLEKNPRFLQELVEKNLRNNPHRLHLILKPKASYRAQLEEKEQQLLEARVKCMTAADKDRIILESEALNEQQSKSHDESCLPALKISDLDRGIKRYEVKELNSSALPESIICEQPTNGICYFRGVFPIEQLTADERDVLPLFASVITQLGADDLVFSQLQDKINSATGGFSCSWDVASHPEKPKCFEEYLIISSHCLLPKVSDMFGLWKKILRLPHFDAEEYLRVLMRNRLQGLELSIEQAGHMYAKNLAESYLNWGSHVAELYSGLSHVRKMRDFCKEDQTSRYMKLFDSILKKCFTRSKSRFALHVPSNSETSYRDQFLGLVSDIPMSECSTQSRLWFERDNKVDAAEAKTRVLFPSQVSYAASSVPTVPMTHPDSPALQVLAKFLTWNMLHQEIREKGGAYGAGASAGSGNLSFYSYRDPTPDNTLQVFARTREFVKSLDISEEMLSGAKMSTFQALDMPKSPSQRGLSYFLRGVTDDMRQKYRDRLFAVTAEDVKRVAETYLGVPDELRGGAVIGPDDKNTRRISWKSVPLFHLYRIISCPGFCFLGAVFKWSIMFLN